MQINEVVVGHLTPAKIKQVLDDYRAGKAVDYQHLRYSTNDFRIYKQSPHDLVLLDNVGVIDPTRVDDYVAKGGYATLKKVLTTMTPEAVVEEVKTSGLRGRGGAGFPTGLKWSFTRPLPVAQKYVICNADEGEPGTIKDRYLMEGDPHKVLEGMAIAGFAVGASKGFIYVRGEYYLSKLRLNQAIAQARAQGYLGEKLFGTDFSFDIEVRSGFGCYICGEETALIESIEGKRGYPRMKPPFPGVAGLWHQPTIVNNVESLAAVPGHPRQGRGLVQIPGHAGYHRHQDLPDYRARQDPADRRSPGGPYPAGTDRHLRRRPQEGQQVQDVPDRRRLGRPSHRGAPWTPPSITAPWPRWAAPWVPAPCWSWTKAFAPWTSSAPWPSSSATSLAVSAPPAGKARPASWRP